MNPRLIYFLLTYTILLRLLTWNVKCKDVLYENSTRAYALEKFFGIIPLLLYYLATYWFWIHSALTSKYTFKKVPTLIPNMNPFFLYHVNFVIVHWCSIWKMLHLALSLSSIPIPVFLTLAEIYLCHSPWANILWAIYRSLFPRKIREMEIGRLWLHFRMSSEITLDPWCMGKRFGWLTRPDTVHARARGARTTPWPIPNHWGEAA